MFRVALSVLALALAAFAERWHVAYFHDVNDSELTLVDLGFATADHGMALGQVSRDRGRDTPVVLVTRDGGAKWSTVETREPGVSLFVLDERAAWLVTTRGVWFSDEGGRAWRKIYKKEGLLRVHFITREHGFAVGGKKTALRTTDGGKTWMPLQEAQNVKTTEEWTVFHGITFTSPQTGIIYGRSAPSRRQDEGRPPIWLDPEPDQRRERPSLSILLETSDGGATWKASTNSLFGTITDIAAAEPDGPALLLIEFSHFFDYPSELYLRQARNPATKRALRQKDFAMTDAELLPKGGPAFAAGFEPAGTLARTPVPGKVRIVRSANLIDWVACPVDYRAVARRVMLAVAANRVWAATDTGMILRHGVD
jgi:hypothetical protein